jgi:arylsulfatase A-like enzyme
MHTHTHTHIQMHMDNRPEFYHNYTDAFGDPAGDYLGTITQMDVQIGRLRRMLRDRGVANNTMLWYTADNGPNPRSGPNYLQRDRNKVQGLSATNGLRQCKASLYEGGIREPGLLEWPAMIRKNARTWHPAYVSDYMPTILEILGVPHEHPDWAKDGISLVPLIKRLSAGAANDTSTRPVANPLVFKLGKQLAIIDNDWKIL